MNLKLLRIHGEICRFKKKRKKYSGEINQFNHGFINCGCLHSATLKAYRVRDIRFLVQNVQNEILKILKMFKNNMKFTWEARCINSKISSKSRQKHHAHDIDILSVLFIIIMA